MLTGEVSFFEGNTWTPVNPMEVSYYISDELVISPFTPEATREMFGISELEDFVIIEPEDLTLDFCLI
jgi:hypothetical protein